jgi:hypothetical protein
VAIFFFVQSSLKMGVSGLESFVEKRCPEAMYPVDIRMIAAEALKLRKGISPFYICVKKTDFLLKGLYEFKAGYHSN